MPVPDSAIVPGKDKDLVMQNILNRLQYGKTYWKPLHDRMDYWSAMYRMEDAIQLMKPPNHRRFISNEPKTAVDLAVSILTRNDSFWRIALSESANENAEERRAVGKIERTLQGMVYDMDEMLSMRLKPRFWKQAAQQALLRGMIWAKIHVTTEALDYKDSPLMVEFYDPRLVYPHTDAYGLDYVIVESMSSVGELVNMYPKEFGDKQKEKDYDPNTPATVIEYWSNDRPGRKGICAVMATIAPVEQAMQFDIVSTNTGPNAMKFVIPPYFHGYKPDALPVIGVAVNGLNLSAMPRMGNIMYERMSDRARAIGNVTPLNWLGQDGFVADTGRSLLAAVEEHVPQYNELIATIFQHLALSTYGTWVFTSPNGEQPSFTPGIESKIALTPDERLDRIQVGPINSDAFKLVELLGDEKQNGMLANILRANTPQQGSGVLFQQMANAALNALEPYSDGMEEFGQRAGTTLLAQLQDAKGLIKPFDVMTPNEAGGTRRQSFWVVEFDPKKDLGKVKRIRPRPVFRPALPDDLSIRIQAARMALDPQRPMLSLTTVLEEILQVADPTAEIDRIWEDIANTDPVLVFEQIVQALERLGETDMAQRISEKQFRTAFIEELQFKQASGASIPTPGLPEGAPPSADPTMMTSDAGGGEFNSLTAQDTTGAPPPPAPPIPGPPPTGV
jgi:hypothetical protein